MQQTPQMVCELSHPGFRLLGEPVFRLSDGGSVPSMFVPLDGHMAVLPLRSVAREFRLEPDSPDGKMLMLIEQALDFVVAIRPGDAFPPELFGGSSWEPSEQDRQAASSRLWNCLARSVAAKLGRAVTVPPPTQLGWETLHENQQLARDAIDGAVELLGKVDEQEARARVATLIAELAYIEAMRRALLRGASTIRDKLLRRSPAELPQARRETLTHVQALARKGLADIAAHLDEADAWLDDAVSMLNGIPESVARLRRTRDWLYRTNHAWTPIFDDWANAASYLDEFTWKTLERTYNFLAPRYMSYQEWTSCVVDIKPQPKNMKVW